MIKKILDIRFDQQFIKPYIQRIKQDVGSWRNETATKQYQKLCKDYNMLDSIRFAWLGEAGYKQRTSGINTFWTKLYSLVGTNDATQTTSTNQPYLSGNIAPNEKWCLKNPNGGDEYMTHPTISFAANEAWSVTTVVNNNGKLGVAGLYSSGVNTTLHCWYYGSFRIRFDNSLSSAYVFNKSLNNLIGKNTIITLSTKGDGTLSLYVNGVFIESEAAVTSIELSKIFFQTSYSFYGTIPIHIIRAQALTPSQVSAEANFLRTLYPEIPSVTIGSQVWATSNCEMVATPQGNLMQNITANSNTEKITGGNFESGLIGTKTDGAGSVSTWTLNNVSPISGTQDGRLVVTNVSASNVRPYISFSGSRTAGKWQKLTFDYKVNSGTCVLYGYWDGSSAVVINETLSGTGTFTKYYNTTGQSLVLYFDGRSLFNLQIDNLSDAEVGWSDATNLYNYVYTNTAGTDEQKTYAAVKAAAMWRYPNNDAAIGVIYNKLFNDYATKLLAMDIAYYNTANPTTPWGWDIPTEAEWTTLQTTVNNDAEALKKDGTVYWSSPNAGNNNSLFTALPAGYVKEDGTFAGLNNTAIFASKDNMDIPRVGKSIRLIKK